MRILFIDTPQALQALEQSLGEVRPHWQVQVISEPMEALRVASTEQFDVVACAWRINRTFGPEVLRRIQAANPDSMRLLLLPPIIDASEAARQVLASAHQCLRKPISAANFATTVERLIAVRWLLADPTLRQLLGRVDRLPSPPRLYLELQQAIGNPNTGLATVARVVGQDPGLATRVLRVANSVLFNRGAAVLDMTTAVNRLGLNVLSQIVLSCEVFTRATHPGTDVEALRRHSLLASQLARKLLPDAEQAQMAATAALLADTVGLLPPEITRAPIKEKLRVPRPWNGLPTEALVAAYLLGIWGMPSNLVEAVAFCHDPNLVLSREPQFAVVGAVHVARALIAEEPIDAAYVESVGVADKLPHWRQMAADLGSASTQSSQFIPRPPAGAGRLAVGAYR